MSDEQQESARDGEPSRAVAIASAEPVKKDVVGELPPHLKAAYQLRQLDRAVHSAIASESWGKKLDVGTRHAIAQYCQKYGVDVTEIDVLGGNIYRNARFYLSRLARLSQEGKVEYAYADHIGADPRFDVLAASADPEVAARAARERDRCAEERAMHRVPEEAIAACVYRVKLKSLDREVTGTKWVVRSDKDPIGSAKPIETAETRAARRCLRQIVPNIDGEDGQMMAAMEADWEVIEMRAATALTPGEKEPPYVKVKGEMTDAEYAASK